MNEPLDVAMDTAGIARVTINRPKSANAIDPPLAASLLEAFEWLANDPKLRVLVLLGNGRTFCAGLDLKAMTQTMAGSFESNYEDALRLAKLLHRLHTMPVPTLAVVPGAAIGLGVGLVAACDVVLASDLATFRFSEVRLGIIPAIISPYVIAAMGARACQRYFLTAEGFDAAEAHRLGLVHLVSSLEEIGAKAAQIVAQLLAGKRDAQRAAKVLIDDVRLAAPNEALIAETARRLAEIRRTPEAQSTLAGFLNP
ncbi:MAG: methylglutaconyl-CoA hydratase [Alphaproteobacteria bacterium]|nr:methylglutaconyl-CoA hydratase [Alphaproteobacteria bacterium]